LGIVMAVVARNRSNQPQLVELGMLDAMISLLSLRLQQVLAIGEDLPRMGSGHPQACPWDVFQAADGPFVIAATRDEYWQRLCGAIGIAEYARREGYATIAERVANRPQVNVLLNGVFKNKPRAHWLKALDDADVPNGPLNSLTEAMADETVRDSGVLLEVDHPAGGSITTAGPPLKFNGSRGARNGPPGLGAHTAAVLDDLLRGALQKTSQGV
jgi:crotonobetainyl-CoA:carnitine CoA-transferase CaiB-like acyl-CoA transferase